MGATLFRNARGQATVEFALALPLLFLITLGLFDAGRAVWSSNILSGATREGARYAIVRGLSCEASGCPLTTAAATTAVTAEVLRASEGIQETPAVTVIWADTDRASGTNVTVSATAPFIPIASRYFTGGAFQITLRASTTMVIR